MVRPKTVLWEKVAETIGSIEVGMMDPILGVVHVVNLRVVRKASKRVFELQ